MLHLRQFNILRSAQTGVTRDLGLWGIGLTRQYTFLVSGKGLQNPNPYESPLNNVLTDVQSISNRRIINVNRQGNILSQNGKARFATCSSHSMIKSFSSSSGNFMSRATLTTSSNGPVLSKNESSQSPALNQPNVGPQDQHNDQAKSKVPPSSKIQEDMSSKAEKESHNEKSESNSQKPKRKWLFFLGALTLLGGGAYFSFDDDIRRGLRRSISFWGRAFPIYIHYRVTQIKVTSHIVAHSLLCPTIEELSAMESTPKDPSTYTPCEVADYSMTVLKSVLSGPSIKIIMVLRPFFQTVLPKEARDFLVSKFRLPGTIHIAPNGRLSDDSPEHLRKLLDSDCVSTRPVDAPEIPGLEGIALTYLETLKGLTYGPLNERYADAVLDAILTLRGYYIKLGQMGSLTEDFFPPAWIRRLETLQSHVPSEPFDYVRNVIESELGKPLEDVFIEFEPEPLGAASIGQTHLARLRSSGELVVVKVQYNNVEQMFAQDMGTIKLFCRLAQPEHLAFLEEIEKQFHTEFDYRIEAKNLEMIAHNMQNSPYSSKVVVPQPMYDMCTKRVLIMEYLPAVKIPDVLLNVYARLIGKSSASDLTQQDLRNMKLYMDKVSTNRIWIVTVYYSIKDNLNNTMRWIYNTFVGNLIGARLQYVKATHTVDMAKTIDLLFRVHAHQVICNGFFNGDPHPGNLLLYDDGRLGLIDFGSCKPLSKTQRRLLARLYNALEKQDWYQIVRVYNHMGYQHMDGCEDIIYQMAVLGFDYDNWETRGGMNVQSYFESLYALNPLPHDIDEWVMPSRVSILLRGLGHALKYPVRTSSFFGPVARDFLRADGRLSLDEATPYLDGIEKARERLKLKIKNLEDEISHIEQSQNKTEGVIDVSTSDPVIKLRAIVEEATSALKTVPPAATLYRSPRSEWIGNLELEDALDILERSEKFLDARKLMPKPPVRNARGAILG